MERFFSILRDEPRKLILRRWLFQVHLWAGIGVGLYVLVISLTGSALVFREEFESVMPAQARLVPVREDSATLEDVRRNVERRFPGYTVAWILSPDKPGLAHDVWYEKGDDARLGLVDPYDGSFLTEVEATTGFWLFLQNLHYYLLGGRVGLLVNGAGGILLLLLSLTGLVIWWPGVKIWKQALKVQSGTGWKRLNWDLHSAAGFWTALFVLMWSVTGAYFAYPQPFTAAIRTVLPMSPGPTPPTLPENAPMAPVDMLVERALTQGPGHRVTWVGLPHHEGDSLATVYLLPEGSDSSFETTYVYLNPVTSEIVQVKRPSDLRTGDLFITWLAALHFGNFGGWGIKLLWAIVGLTPALLFATGSLMWWNRVLSKRWRAWGQKSSTGAGSTEQEWASTPERRTT